MLIGVAPARVPCRRHCQRLLPLACQQGHHLGSAMASATYAVFTLARP